MFTKNQIDDSKSISLYNTKNEFSTQYNNNNSKSKNMDLKSNVQFTHK